MAQAAQQLQIAQAQIAQQAQQIAQQAQQNAQQAQQNALQAQQIAALTATSGNTTKFFGKCHSTPKNSNAPIVYSPLWERISRWLYHDHQK